MEKEKGTPELMGKKPSELGGRKLPEIPEEIRSNIKRVKKRIKEDFELSKRIGNIRENDMPIEKEEAHENSHFNSHFKSKLGFKEERSIKNMFADPREKIDNFEEPINKE